MRLLFLILLLFYSLLDVLALDIKDITQKYNLLTQSRIYIDTNSNSSDEMILKKLSQFVPNKKEFIHQGYTTDSVWLHFSLNNSSDTKIKKVLSLNNAMLDHIILYTKNGENFTSKKLGVLHNRTFDENILTFYFDIVLPPHTTKDYFLKVKADSCPIFFNLDLMDKEQLYQDEIEHQLILTLFFGAMGALLLYNLFLYFFTKDRAYLYYVLYQLFLLQNHISLTTMGLYVYWPIMPNWWLEFDTFAAIYYLGFNVVFMILFTRTYLQTKTYPKIDLGLKLFLVLIIGLMLITSRTFYPIDLMVLLLQTVILYLISVGIYLSWKKVSNANYFIIGWGILIVGYTILAMYYYGLTEILHHHPYLFELCVFTEAILFSIALAARLNKTRELELSLDRQAILTKELHHRVKNNMQFIIALYRLKLQNADDLKLTEIENSIKAMSNVHELLYIQDDLDKIDAKLFFQTLINELKMTLKMQNITIDLKAEAKLEVQQAIYCAIILNELVTNAVKYAFDESGGEILVKLNEENNHYNFMISDNGKGYDTTSTSQGFGLVLIHQLVEKELGGEIEVDSVGGSRYVIRWRE